MPIARFEMPDGKIARFEVPEGTTPEQAQAQIQQFAANQPQTQEAQPQQSIASAQQPAAEDRSVLDTMSGGLEVAGTMVSGAIAEPIAGIAGVAQSLNPFADEGAGARAVDATRNALTNTPESEAGQDILQGLQQKLEPVIALLQKAEEVSGETGYDLAGPLGGAIGKTVPTAIMEALSLGAGRLAGSTKQLAKATPDARTANLLDAAKSADVPLLTTDVFPPRGYAGRFVQSVSEKLGPLGTGTARASQQRARQAAVSALAENLDIDIDSPFATDMFRSLDSTIKRELKQAGEIRTKAVDKLDQFGDVPMTRTEAAIAEQIAKQKRLGPKGDQALVQNLENIMESLRGGDFSLVKDIRTEVISDLKAISRGEDTRSAASIQAVKSAMDNDMMRFARANDRDAAAGWIRSNRAFGDAYSRAKDTELKRLLKTGQATPEKIMTLIRGGKPSELQRLSKTMGPRGQQAARKAIIQDALKESKFFEVDSNPNPDVFANALNKSSRQQAIKVFFKGEDKAQIDGLNRLLNETRRAQQGSAVAKTGEQWILGGLTAGGGYGAATAPQVAIPLAVGTSVIIKTYESRPFRNLLIKLANTRKGSRAEQRILDAASTLVVSGYQAAKEQQPQTEEIEQ